MFLGDSSKRLNIPVEITYIIFPQEYSSGVNEGEALWRAVISSIVLAAGFIPFGVVYGRRIKWLKQSESVYEEEALR